MHGSAAGTATPKQPKNSLSQRFNKGSLRGWLGNWFSAGLRNLTGMLA